MSTPTLPDSVKELGIFDSSGGGGGVMDSETAAKLVYSRSCLARFMFQPTARLFITVSILIRLYTRFLATTVDVLYKNVLRSVKTTINTQKILTITDVF